MTDLPQSPVKRRWYQAIGPGLITACVVIGPGSILTSSKVGANEGYSMLWVVITACIFMMFYMQMGARLGVVSQESPAEILTRKAGRWLAVVVGLGVKVSEIAPPAPRHQNFFAHFIGVVNNHHTLATIGRRDCTH